VLSDENCRAAGDIGKLLEFRNINVVPGGVFYVGRRLVEGGPVWPDFEAQTIPRFAYGGEFVDRNATDRGRVHATETRPCIWGGYGRNHFGHFVAEHASRLLRAAWARPDDLVLFIVPRKLRQEPLARHVYDVAEWLGAQRQNLRVVTHPLKVTEFRVAAQEEQLGFGPPGTDYLRLLQENMLRQRLVAKHSRLLYVTRAGMLGHGKGGHAGEGYLVRLLRNSGVTVLDPAEAPLRRQLALYAGARHIVFAEGSALHGRQLLGVLDQEILVLNRNFGSRTAERSLTPRCTGLTYVEGIARIRETYNRKGEVVTPQSLAEYDVDVLLQTFRELGVDLARDWDTAAYKDARDRDIQDWKLFHGNRLNRQDDALQPAGFGGIDRVDNAIA
jgi:Glycosyltransferase 61